MKLYAFFSRGSGTNSYFVMAVSQEEATAAVHAKFEQDYPEYIDDWSLDRYVLEVFEAGEVAASETD